MKFNRAQLVAALDAAIAAAVQRNQVARQRNAETVERVNAEFLAKVLPGWEQFAQRIQEAVAEGRLPTRQDLPEAIRYDGYRDIQWKPNGPREERLPVPVERIADWLRLSELLKLSNDPEVTTTGLRDLGFKGEQNMLLRILSENPGETQAAEG